MSPPIESLYQLARALQKPHQHPRDILQIITQQTHALFELSQSGYVMLHEDGDILDGYLFTITETDHALWHALLERGLAGYVYHNYRRVVIHNVKTDLRWTTHPTLPQSGSAIGYPIYRGDHVCAVLLFMQESIAFFDDDVTDTLQEIVDMAQDALNQVMDYRGGTDRRYHTLFDNAVVPIILTDMNGHIIDLNQQATNLIGYMPNDLVDKPITQLHPLDTETIYQQLELDTETSIQTTLRIRDGDDIPVMLRLRHLQIDGNHVVELILNDIRPQMELEQLRRDLAAMVYHDLRGPLHTLHSSIQKLSQLLANHEEPAIWTLLQVGLRSSRQLRRMVDSLLDVQRLEEGSKILDTGPTELHALLAEATGLVQPLAVEAGQRLKFALADNLPVVTIDSDMIIRVVVNLLENAVKYTPAGGMITLIAYAQDREVVIRVRDTGPGIPEEMQEKVFDKFNRVKYKQAPKGIGLGLAFCRLAVNAHGGEIWVDSPPGQGSDFVFTLPIHNKPESTSEDDTTQLATTA
jgi:two-component system, NtrC family, sensor histidine kinase KinB